MVFTGHSLGRVKRERLLAKGSKPESIETRYRISRRIEAEENALDHAAFVVASTRQEVEEQYELYDHYQPRAHGGHPARRRPATASRRRGARRRRARRSSG